MSDIQTRMLINGQWVQAKDGNTQAVINPATEETVAEVCYGGVDDAHAAIDAATAAMPAWREQTAEQRCDTLRAGTALLRQRVDQIARLLTMEQGKPVPEAKGELLATAKWIDWCAENAKRLYGHIVPASAPNKRIFVTHQPIGVCAVISPWNFPVLLAARNIGGALAVGCSAVSRPASQTPLALLAVAECLHDGGLPAGVLNVITGRASKISDVFFDRPEIRKICFTGSTAVGKELLRRSADQVKRVSLELGGHAPFIVLPDADMNQAGRLASASKFRNNGQVCISASRFFVHPDVAGDFAESVADHTSQMKVGNGLDAGVQIGPLFETKQLQQAQRLVDDAVSVGAKTRLGGKRHPDFDKGYFFQPTVLTDVPANAKVLREEPFSPIMPIMQYKDLDDAIAQANDTEYGLAAYIVTNRIDWATYLADRLEAGIIGVNEFSPATPQAPFGGMKQSGIGREGGPDALHEYVETKYVALTLPEQISL